MSQPLRRTLRTADLVLIVIGTVIGSGIFLVPGEVLRRSGGSVMVAMLVWVVGGVLSLLGALTYAELGAARPGAGGLYVFIRDGFGPLPAFLFGWTTFFVIGSGSMATLAAAFARYLDELVPLGAVSAKLVSVAMIGVVAALNVLGTRHSSRVQNWSTALKVVAIVVLSGWLLVAGGSLRAPDTSWAPPPFSAGLISGAGLAMVSALWAYEGWHYVTFSGAEAIEPQRTLPRGIVTGTAAVIAVYLLANLAYISALGAEAAARSDRIAADAIGAVLGPAAPKLLAVVILVSIFSAANGLTLTAPRLYFAMARDGVFFRKLGDVHPRTGTPALAIVGSAAWAAVLAATGTFEELLTFVVFTGWIFYALAAASIFVHRRRAAVGGRPFAVPGYPVTPLLFVLSAAAIVVNTLVSVPGRAMLGLAVVLLGTPAYAWWRARAPAAAASGAAREG